MGGVANTSKIAYWNGSAWAALSTGLNGSVLAMEFSPNGDLYIAGSFTNADGTNGDYICYWDGTAFHMLGDTELSAFIEDMTLDENGVVYATGEFTNAGGDSDANYIARFKGNKWEALGTGLNAKGQSIDIKGDKLIVSGNFTNAGGLDVLGIATWSGGAWGSFIFQQPSTTGIIQDILITNNNVFIAGSFSSTIVTNDSVQCTNSGNANVYPTIEITGPGVLQSITNYTTGREIQFDGLTLQAGEIVTLKLDPTDIDMTSTWTGRGNLLKYVNPGSDLGQFYLKPDTNYISLFMPSGTTAATKAYIYWTPKFWNIEGSRYE
jgi:hypothetical protein